MRSAAARLLNPQAREAENLRREQAKRIAAEIRDGIAETVAAEESRGAVFIKPAAQRGAPPKPVQRKTALLLLFERRQLSERQYEAGKRYAKDYATVYGRGSYRCAINPDPRGVFSPSQWGISDGRTAALNQLMAARGMRTDRDTHQVIPEGLFGKAALISLADRLCGEDITPTAIAESRNGAPEILGKCQIMLEFLADFYKV